MNRSAKIASNLVFGASLMLGVWILASGHETVADVRGNSQYTNSSSTNGYCNSPFTPCSQLMQGSACYGVCANPAWDAMCGNVKQPKTQ
jgi:hypothetical protein